MTSLAVTGRLSGPIFTREARFAYPLSFFWLAQIYATFVRDTDALAKLPEAERADWQKFWAEVGALLKRVSAAK